MEINSTVLNLSFPGSIRVEDWPFDSFVYVPFEDFDYEPGYLMAHEAFKTFAEASTHFWFRYPEHHPRLKKMTVLQFLNNSKTDGMNPFETLARFESMVKFGLHKIEKESKGNERL